MEFFKKLFQSDFMPHGHCYFWKPEVLWTNVIGDAIIVIAYFSIPYMLYYFVKKRPDIRFRGLFILFSLFIFSCGTTHLLDVISVWTPIYRFEGLLKIITGIISLLSAYMLFKTIPLALSIPTRSALNDAHNKLSNKTKELERHNEYLKYLACATSHDLKEPARSIAIFTQNILNKNHSIDDELREKITYVANESKRMYNIIDSLLNFSFIESESYDFTTIDLEKVVFLAQSSLRVVVEENNAIISYESLPEIQANELLLSILFQNLFSNSIKFKRNGVNPIINLSYTDLGNDIKLKITDNGIGFNNEYKEKIFQMFKKLHTAQEYEGSGLGLAICKRIVEIHGGLIEAQSDKNTGTTIIIQLPKRQKE